MIEIKLDMPDLGKLLEEKGTTVLKTIAQDLRAAMVRQMIKPKTGAEYARGSGVHRASAPGEAPAEDSSNLIGSLIPEANDRQVTMIMADYGYYLDQGISRSGRNKRTKTVGPMKNVNVAPRPFIMPSLDEVIANLNK
jgi:hypothetical protein